MRSLILTIISALLLSCTTQPAVESPSPPPSVVLVTATPTAAPTSSPSPEPSRPGIVITAAGQIPANSLYVLEQLSGAERVLLLDLTAKKSREVLHFDRPQAGSRSVVMSASLDGQTIAILERSDATRVLHILKPATGAIRSLPQPDGVDGPSLAPDGSRVAVSYKTSDPVLNGLWLLPVDGSVGTRLIAEDPALVGSPPQPRAWSVDGRWLAAYGNAGGGTNQILVLDTRAGSATYSPPSGLSGGDGRILVGIDAVWRGSEVLTWNSRAASSAPPAVMSYDVQTRATATLYTAGSDENILDVVGRPNSRQIGLLTRPFSNVTPGTPSTIVLADPGSPSRVLASNPFISLVRWSADGANLFVRVGGDDSTGGISDVFGSWGTMPYCLRGGDAPPCL